MDTLGRMKAFVEIVDAEGYSAAARKMGRSKALLSKYVRELEDELSALLINRTTRQFSLTEAGAQYYQMSSDILERISEMQDNVRETSKGLKGKLRVAAPRSWSGFGFGEMIAGFVEQNPDIVLELELEDRLVDLVNERFDIAIRIGKMDDSSLIVRKLADFRLVICGSPEFFQKNGLPRTPRDLSNFPAIVDTNYRSRNNWTFENGKEGEFAVSMQTMLEVNDPLVCRRMALSGHGITMVPEFVLREQLADGSLHAIFSELMPTGAGIYAVYAQRRHIPAKTRALVDFMADWFRKNPGNRNE